MWFQQKANEFETAMCRGKGVWKGLRDIQRGRAGLRPVRPRAIQNASRSLCMGLINTLQHWHEHFKGILNVRSELQESVIQEAICNKE